MQEPAHTGSRKPIMSVTSHALRLRDGSLKPAKVGVFTPWKRAFLFLPERDGCETFTNMPLEGSLWLLGRNGRAGQRQSGERPEPLMEPGGEEGQAPGPRPR